MNVIKTHPIFVAIVALFMVAMGAEAWMWQRGQAEERRLAVQLNDRIAEIDRLQRRKPAPHEDNLRRVDADFQQNAEILRTMLSSLNVGGADELEYFRGEPIGRTEAYFDVAQFVDAMRLAAAEAGVVIPPDERFGFAAYANVGPEQDLIRPVYRQRRIVEYLLGALFAARPHALVAVQREDPAIFIPPPEPGAGSPARAANGVAAATPRPSRAASYGDGGPVSEIFAIDPQITARTPGYVDTMAIRIIFTGQTSSLRGFMNALAVPEIPLVVRSVEAEPLQSDAGRAAAAGMMRAATGGVGVRGSEGAAETPADLAIVADNESRFTVTVELFEVKIRAPEAAPDAVDARN